jgi:hypothetical protein
MIGDRTLMRPVLGHGRARLQCLWHWIQGQNMHAESSVLLTGGKDFQYCLH